MNACWNCKEEIKWDKGKGACCCEEVHYKCKKCGDLDSEINCKGLFCVKCNKFYCNYCWQIYGILIGTEEYSTNSECDEYSNVEDGDYICGKCCK